LHDPHTLFKGVHAVEAGQAIRIRPSGRWEPHTFFALSEAVDADLYRRLDGMPDGEVAAEVGQVVGRSVELHLASDAPVGVLLSGGLDSSLVACLSREHLPNLRAYHADVRDRFSEVVWAETVARHADMPLRVAGLTPETYIRT